MPKVLISDKLSPKAEKIFIERGVEVDVITENLITGRAAVPSGASTGALEAHELRDNDPSFNGMGVNKAIENVKTIISDTLIGVDVTDQSNICLLYTSPSPRDRG